jgi:hypothetical protein
MANWSPRRLYHFQGLLGRSIRHEGTKSESKLGMKFLRSLGDCSLFTHDVKHINVNCD